MAKARAKLKAGGALRALVTMVAAGMAPGAASGQVLPEPAEEMAALSWLVGEWEGEGWIVDGGGRGTFRGTETVEHRMGERLVVVEGRFTAAMGPAGDAVPVHEAFGVLSWNERAGEYVFRTYTARGARGEANAAEVADGRVVWGYDDPRMGRVRYTITRTEDGRWREVGHASSDGETWRQFFEMVLTRR